jgi:penicillin-binding protein 1A
MLAKFFAFLFRMIVLAAIIGACALVCIFYYYSKDLPDYSQLQSYYPPSITRIYSADGKLIEEFAKEKRIFVPINAIPQKLKEAFIAGEDKNFYYHEGIDFMSITRAAFYNIIAVARNQRVQGASTITQQVVKNFLLSSERSFERKIKEAILSYRISQVFSKNQILELYLNQIYLGKGAYGVAVAALTYFNKSIEELTISECAVLASLPKAPSQYNPEKNLPRAIERKNYVINRMHDDGYITDDEAQAALKEPIKLVKFDKVLTVDADYYAAKVREEVIEMFGEEYFYSAGLSIFTPLDSKLQKAATAALRYGIKKYDVKRGYRGAIAKISLDGWREKLQHISAPEGLLDNVLAVALEVGDNKAVLATALGRRYEIFLKDLAWAATDLKSIRKILSPGDVVAAKIENEKMFLSQIPNVNGGIMVIEYDTGRVLAAEGGYDFGVSKFDRTTQAKRQPGSLIKPFVYMAALEKGAKPNDIFQDAPIEVYQGAGLPIWRPKNYEDNFLGPVTLRKGLEKSRNTVTVRIGQFAGLSHVANLIGRFGINDNPPLRYSMVLGSLETTLSKMTSAYAGIANGGTKIEPQYIEIIKDRKGNIIYKRDYSECPQCKIIPKKERNISGVPAFPQGDAAERLIDDATSYQMISLLKGGIQRGTGASAKHLKHYIAGKTGTTNQAKDAWFIGFTPRVVVGTYIGYDNPRSLGARASGATIALPVFIHFMENGYQDEPVVDFPVPNSIELKAIDYDTGQFYNGQGAILEAFKKDIVKSGGFFNQKQEPYEIQQQIPNDAINGLEDIDSSEEMY